MHETTGMSLKAFLVLDGIIRSVATCSTKAFIAVKALEVKLVLLQVIDATHTAVLFRA